MENENKNLSLEQVGCSSEQDMKLKKQKKTSEIKKKRRIVKLIITASAIGLVVVMFLICALIGVINSNINLKKISTIETVGSTLTPIMDSETGYWTFTTDNEFKVLQLTDIHIGAGYLSKEKDAKAIDAVATLVKRVKPDLVIITGDIAYPVPFQAGTFNNKREAKIFASLMEQLGVYWTVTFGNHDTEAYSFYDREQISDFYSQDNWKYCLYERGPADIDGFGNNVINVKNSTGIITHSFYMFDSHSYTNGDILGINWEYDNIKENQVTWYEKEVKRLDEINATKGGGKIKSTAYFHIPLAEYLDAWTEYTNNNNTNTADVTFNQGVAGESGQIVYPGVGSDNLFEKMVELNNTVGIFCGHDHLNNFSVTYKGIALTYGMSIDYLAYKGIDEQTEQRGGTVVTIANDGSINIAQERLA